VCSRTYVLVMFVMLSVNIIGSGADGQVYTVNIMASPNSTLINGSTYDYPILSSVKLTCMVDPSPPNGTTYRWNTTGCFISSKHNITSCFPNGQTTQSVVGDSLLAQDAGAINCIATIKSVNHTSKSVILRISGILMHHMHKLYVVMLLLLCRVIARLFPMP